MDSDVLFLPQGQEEVLPVSARADPSNGYVKGNRFMSDVQPKGYEMVSFQPSLVYHLVHCHLLLLPPRWATLCPPNCHQLLSPEQEDKTQQSTPLSLTLTTTRGEGAGGGGGEGQG